jgi:hypothetical protein
LRELAKHGVVNASAAGVPRAMSARKTRHKPVNPVTGCRRGTRHKPVKAVTPAKKTAKRPAKKAKKSSD